MANITKPPILDETGQAIAAALANVSIRPQIVDNLTTDDSTKALSASQGKALNDKINLVTPFVADIYAYSITVSAAASASKTLNYNNFNKGDYILFFETESAISGSDVISGEVSSATGVTLKLNPIFRGPMAQGGGLFGFAFFTATSTSFSINLSAYGYHSSSYTQYFKTMLVYMGQR